MVRTERKVTRHEDKKGYSVEGYNQSFVGITTLLSKTKDEESKQALLNWLKKPNATEETKRACQRGSFAHKIMEKYGQGIPVNKGAAYKIFKGYVDPLVHWFDNNVTSVLAQEQAVYHTDGFAGTYDLLATLKGHGDKPVLCDYKTSRRSRLANPVLLEDYLCQVAAYTIAMKQCRDLLVERALLVIAVDGKLELKFIGPGPLKAYQNTFMERVLEYKQLELSK